MMITGDSVPIARDVAEQVGIGTKILPAKALKTGTAADKIQLIHESDGFANVFQMTSIKSLSCYKKMAISLA